MGQLHDVLLLQNKIDARKVNAVIIAVCDQIL